MRMMLISGLSILLVASGDEFADPDDLDLLRKHCAESDSYGSLDVTLEEFSIETLERTYFAARKEIEKYGSIQTDQHIITDYRIYFQLISGTGDYLNPERYEVREDTYHYTSIVKEERRMGQGCIFQKVYYDYPQSFGALFSCSASWETILGEMDRQIQSYSVAKTTGGREFVDLCTE